MPVNIEKLDTLLAALKAKDLPALVAAQVTIPFLSKPYTLKQLEAWLAKRVDQLESAKMMTDEQLASLKTTLYNRLNSDGKQIADKTITPVELNIKSLSPINYDRLVGLKLLQFVSE